MSAIKIRDNIYAVGARDPEVRIFHGYATPFGATYNCYLILDGDKKILVDNVKAAFTEEFFRNIEEICPVESLDILIQNHIEPDHSGSFPALLERCPNLEVYCTAGAQKGLKAYYGWEGACHVVKMGETLNTGSYTFQFIPAPMVHWPDSMLTYLAEEKILFSNDAFGQHICPPVNYDDELGEERLMERAVDYYGNIVLPFGMQVTNLLKAASALDIELVCPSHGVMLRTYIGKMVESYAKWAKNETDPNKVVMVYDSMWGSTAEMTRKICAEFEAEGKQVHVHCLADEHYSAVMGDIVEAKTICIGASTLNNTLMPTVAAFLTYLKGLKPKNRVGLAYGSYGWSGEATKEVAAVMEGMGWEVLPIRKQLYRG
ncbi:FprA family A-type flavoprotein [Butyricicoccus pullicaecorum]|uniref:FprA family A-type flavoprotein n=1 Tax=Butyricicoccus pullicaecorum TaxID=501571 RepID=UPI003521934C